MDQIGHVDIEQLVPLGATGTHSASSTLTCQWQGCQAPHHPSAESLYDHVCEAHIGRKSTNNLNLQCFWGACRVTTVKRDHITSHIRVHVPLKPHKCDFCGKSFKRPQDLKKHVKTHADESVLFNAPQASAGNGRPPPNGYQAPGMNGNHDGSYGDASGNQHMNYAYGNGAGAGGPAGHAAYNPSAMGGTNFAPLYAYGGSNPMSYGAGAGLTESRKRTHDALNDFFAQTKRRQLDASQYQDLGAQFSQFLAMFSGGATGAAAHGMAGGNPGGWQHGGYNAGYAGAGGPTTGGAPGAGGAGYEHDGGMAYHAQHAAPPAPMGGMYSTPFQELRTKNDLMSIDQFLEQLQHTVYDNADQVTAVGYQPHGGMGGGMHAAAPHAGGYPIPLHRNGAGGSPNFKHAQAVATPSSSYSGAMSSSTFDDTPALTPSSFQASQSPQSSNRNISPGGRASAVSNSSGGGSLYPTLPHFNTLDATPGAFGVGAAAPAGLGPQYEDYDGRRRWSGGQLQRARQSPPAAGLEGPSEGQAAADAKVAVASGADAKATPADQAMADEEGAATPKQDDAEPKLPGAEGTAGKEEGGESAVEDASSPSAADTAAPAEDADAALKAEPAPADPKAQAKEAFEINVKVIEALRAYLNQRLQRGEYEEEEGEEGQQQAQQEGQQQEQQQAQAQQQHDQSEQQQQRQQQGEQEEDDGNRTPRANQDVEMKEGDDDADAHATTPKREGASLYPMLRPVEA